MKKLLLALLLLWPAVSHATTYYVSKTGNNGNGLTPANAKTTIAAGLALIGTGAGAGAGHIVEVSVGTYAEIIRNTLPSGTSWASPFTLKAKTGDLVTIQATDESNIYLTSGGTGGNMYSIVDGFTLNGSNLSNNQITISVVKFVRFTNLNIVNTSNWSGIYIGSSQNIEIINNSIHDGAFLPAGFGHGIYVEGDNNLMEGNDIYNVAAFGITVYSNSGLFPSNNVIRKNKAHNCGTNRPSAPCLHVSTGNNNQVYNNIVWDNPGLAGDGGTGIAAGGGSPKVYNNTVYGNSWYGIDLFGSTGALVRNNIVYGNGIAFNVVGGATLSNNFCGTVTAGCMSQAGNPAFVGPTTGVSANFHLTAGSPAIGKGCGTACGTEMSSLYTDDFEGNPRGTVPWDAGAYEYGAVAGDSMTINSPSSSGTDSWTIGNTQTISWICVGCGAGVDIDISRNGAAFTALADNYTTNPNSFSWTVTGPANATNVIRIRDNDATPTATSANFSITASSGGGLTKRITDNSGSGNIPGVDETYMWSQGVAVNYGGDQDFYVAKPVAGDHSHGLIRFTGLSQIPSTATVTSVTLGLYVIDSPVIAQTFDLRRVLRTWVEGQATWNFYSGTIASPNNWTTAGGLGAATDRVSTAVGQLSCSGTLDQYCTLTDTGTFKTFIQNIVSGTAPNEGLHLEDTTEAAGYIGFVSSEGMDTHRPYLDVTYTVGTSTITVTEPKSGDLFLAGQTGPVRWTSQGISGSVTIDLSRDGGTTWENLTTAGYDQADVSVTYNAPTSSNCKVRVTSVDQSTVIGTSGGAFRIGGTRAGFTIAP